MTAPLAAAPPHSHSAAGPAVVGGKLHHVSATQLATAERCLRKWWHSKVAGTPDRSSPASRDLGSQVHQALEKHFRGDPADAQLHPVARPGLVHLPEPGPDLLVEAPMVPPMRVQGVPWVGNIDLLVPPTPAEPQRLWVLDHKTTSDFRYAKSPAELCESYQMVGYARWAALRWWGEASLHREGYVVKLSHVYYHTRPERLAARAERARRVDALLPTTAIAPVWDRAERLVAQLHATAAEADPARVPGNFDACGDFGGCPYRAQCHGGQGPTREVGFSPLAALVAPRVPGVNKDLRTAAVARTLPPTPPATPPTHSPTPESAPIPMSDSSHNPPDFLNAPSTSVAPDTTVKGLLGELRRQREAADAKAKELAAESRARELTEKFLGGVPQVLPVPPLEAPPVAPAPPPPAARELVLYIGCMPLVGPHVGQVRPLEQLLADYAAPILQEYRAKDLRLIPYAEGKGRLAAALRDNPPSGCWAAATPGGSELLAVVLEALTPLATQVVMAAAGR